MQIKISEKKGKKTIEEYYEVPLLRIIVNFLIYILLSFMVVGFFLFFFISQGKLDTYNNLWLVSIMTIFLILWIKSSYGNFDCVYLVLTKKKWLSSIMGEIHGLLYILFVFIALLSKGNIILTLIPFMANLFFAISLSLTIYLYLIKNVGGIKWIKQ